MPYPSVDIFTPDGSAISLALQTPALTGNGGTYNVLKDGEWVGEITTDRPLTAPGAWFDLSLQAHQLAQHPTEEEI